MPVIPDFFVKAGDHAERLVTPSLLPICARPGGSDRATHQSGTGFLIAHHDRPVLVTARHVLYAHKYDEDPLAKHIVFNGRLRLLFELRSEGVLQDLNNDLAAVRVDELGLLECLPMSCLSFVEATCTWITLYGLLARDFRRKLSDGSIKSQPYRVTNERAAWRPGYTGLRYQKGKNSDRSGRIVQAARPSGMSGAPMLDTAMLGAGIVVIVGVFTDYVREKGLGFGESAPKVIALLEQLGSAA
jgi:hypothetical protein